MTSQKKAKPHGQTFRERRLQLGLTQKEIATRLGVTQVTVSLFENKSDHHTRTLTLIRYAAALDTTIEELFGEQS